MDKVKNEQKDVLPAADTFNDYDILEDTLSSLKHLSTTYGLLVQEASNKQLSDNVDKIAKQISKLARDTFNLMFANGWYELTEEDQMTIDETYNKFDNKRKDF